MNRLKFLATILAIIGLSNSAFAWDCSDPAVDCSDLIIQKYLPAKTSSALQAQTLPSAKTEILKAPTTEDAQDLLNALQEHPEIDWVEPALRTQLAEVPAALSVSAEPEANVSPAPNDPLYEEQYYLSGSLGADLGILNAWSVLTTSKVIVAVIDSGIDYNHEDLQENIWTNIGEIPDNGIDDDENGFVDDVHGYNFYDGHSDPMDLHMHGTHVAGIIGAIGNNARGVTGLLWDTEIMALRFTDENGAGNTAKAIQAIHYAVNNGARVINMSWTIQATTDSEGSLALSETIQAYASAGVIFVSASGNGDLNGFGFNIDEDPVFPASIVSSNLISVGALSTNNELASYSNYGVHSVDIAAPGTSIMSTLPNDDYGRLTGTSAAAAFVSAAAAMILQEAPQLSGLQVKNLLMNEANAHSTLQAYVYTGGSLNITQALNGIGSNSSLTTPPAPTKVSPSSSVDNNTEAFTQPASGFGCQLIKAKNTKYNPLSLLFLILFSGAFLITLKIKSL